MGSVLQDIKTKNFKNLYLLYGEESYLRLYYLHQLVNNLVDVKDNLNYSYFEGSNVDVSQVIDMVNTMPFMSERRVVLCENTGWLSSKSKAKKEETSEQNENSDGETSEDEAPKEEEENSSGAEKAVLPCLLEISEDVVFVLCESKVDKRSKLYKLINSKGTAEEFAKKDKQYLIRWVVNYAANCQKKMDERTASYFVEEIGDDMNVLALELEKAIAWCLNKDKITIADVDAVCTHQITDKVFDMITAISLHQQKKALDLYYDLLSLRESPFKILALIERQYNQMLAIRELTDKGSSIYAMIEKTGMQDWQIRRQLPVVKKYTYDEIVKCLNECVEADAAIKSGNMTDLLSVETLIVRFSANEKSTIKGT